MYCVGWFTSLSMAQHYHNAIIIATRTHLGKLNKNVYTSLHMWKMRFITILILFAGAGIGYFDYTSELSTTVTTSGGTGTSTPTTTTVPATHPFKLGLDLSGGTHLLYSADISSIPADEIDDAVASLRDVIERRVNLFGVAEPIVQVERPSLFAEDSEDAFYRLIVELPGVTDTDEAIAMIGETPIIEFKKERPEEELLEIQKAFDAFQADIEAGREPSISPLLGEEIYVDTGLTGRFLDRAVLEFDQTTREPVVSLEFNKEGADLFAEITRENVGKVLAIYLDGSPISEPVIRQEILGGRAVISGLFTPEEAKILVGRLNSGALPIDELKLLSTQTIGPSLGEEAKMAGVVAGKWGLGLVALFLIFWYRLPGVLAVISLGTYLVTMLALFKLIPITLTAAGIAGFVLSIGMAVDANILIFERMKEEFLRGKDLQEGIREGFARAWLSIRDGNLSSIITAVILFWFGTSLIEGFALTFGLGIIVSMLSAIIITRTFLFAVAKGENKGAVKFLFGTGISLPKKAIEEQEN